MCSDGCKLDLTVVIISLCTNITLLCHTPETDIMLYVTYTSIKNNQFKHTQQRMD